MNHTRTRQRLDRRWAAACGAGALLALVVVTLSSAGPDSSASKERWAGTLLVQLAVSDLDRAIHFYTDTLGFELQERNEELNWARIDCGISNVTIGLGAGEPAEGSGSVSMNFGVRNIDRVRRELEAKGVEFLGPTINIPGVVQLADFHDPDGNKIRLAGHSAGYGEE